MRFLLKEYAKSNLHYVIILRKVMDILQLKKSQFCIDLLRNVGRIH